MTTLVTAQPTSRQPGAVPTAPVAAVIARRLAAAGEAVRVLSPASEHWHFEPEIEYWTGAVTEPSVVAAAARGATRVFLAGLVGEPPSGLRDLANALLAGGVRRVVILDSHGSDFDDEVSDETWQSAAFERVLERRQVGWVRLRPTAVMANALVGGYPIAGSGVVHRLRAGQAVYEYLPDAPYPFIHESDLAEIAVGLLFDESRHGVVDVSGPTVTARERVTAIAGRLGVTPSLVEIGEQEAADRWLRDGWPASTVEVMRYALPALLAEPRSPEIRGQQQRAHDLLGRPPRTFEQWVHDAL